MLLGGFSGTFGWPKEGAFNMSTCVSCNVLLCYVEHYTTFDLKVHLENCSSWVM